MSIRVYNRFLDLLFEIDRYQSLQFKRNFHGISTFELHINRYINGADTLEKGNLIALNKQNNKVGIILTKEIALDENGKESENFKLTGYSLEGLMQRRITEPPSDMSHDRISGSAESVMKHYVYNNFINTTRERQMPFLEIADNQSRGEHIKYESRYKTVSDELENISISTGLGWIIYADFNTKKLIFDVVERKDRQQDNRQGNNPVFFSPEFETIKSQSFIDSDNDLRNVGIVGGQGEGVDRKIVKIGNVNGWDRIETFVDARDVSDKDEETEKELTDEEVEQLLIERGHKKMDDMETIFTLEAEILSPTKESVYEYEKDFDLGDIVNVVNKSWNLTMTAPITEITEIYEPGGFRLDAVFGRNRPTLTDKLTDRFNELEGIEKQEAPERVTVKRMEEVKEYARDQDDYVRDDAQDFADESERKSNQYTDETDTQNRTYTKELVHQTEKEIEDTKLRLIQAEKDLGEADKKIDTATTDLDRLEKEFEEIDFDIEIGGRNYVRELGGDNYNLDSIYSSDRRRASVVNIEGKKWIKYTGYLGLRIGNVPVDPGEEYTWSFKVYADKPKTIRINFYGSGSYNAKYVDVTTTPKKVYTSGKTKPDVKGDILHIWDLAEDDNYYFADFQLEKGNKATDWTPAPEDVQSEIDKANARINTSNQDIKNAQDLINSVTEDKDGQTVLKGTLVTNEIIAELATLTGTLQGANATINNLTTNQMHALQAIIEDATIKGQLDANTATMLGLTTKQMTAINAVIQDATITGTLNATDAIFQKGRFEQANIIRAIIEKADIVDADLSGSFNIYRPDGAISMSDGMIDTGYLVNGYDPHHMAAGKHDGNTGNDNFPAFTPGAEGLTSSHIYGAVKGVLDGRGQSNNFLNYKDIRDGLGKIVFQRYSFVRSARYIVFRFRKYPGSKFSVHIVRGDSDKKEDRIMFEVFEADVRGAQLLIVDLGVPDYKTDDLTLNIGWANTWGPKDEVLRFIVESVYLTDFI